MTEESKNLPPNTKNSNLEEEPHTLKMTVDESSLPLNKNKNSLLYEWLLLLLDGKKVNVEISTLNDFIEKELKIELRDLDERLKFVLPYMVVYFSTIWLKSIKLNECIKSVSLYTVVAVWKQFVHQNLDTVIAQTFHDILEKMYDVNDCCQAIGGFFAPYCIQIQCPPKVLNTIYFTEQFGDILMKQHSIRPWIKLNYTQLIHWPYVSVEFQSPDLCFKRDQFTIFKRYLNNAPHRISMLTDSTVEYAEHILKSEPRICFTYKYLAAYTEAYLALLERTSLPTQVMDDIRVLLWHLVQDVKDIKMNGTVATNTLIKFRLSTSNYARVKKLTYPDLEQSLLGYSEVIVPRVSLQIPRMNDTLDETDDVLSFTSLKEAEKMKKAIDFIPVITYSCLYCKKRFQQGSVPVLDQVLEHFQFKHTMEAPLRCTLCKTLFEVIDLASNRWHHHCQILDGQSKKRKTSKKQSSTQKTCK